MSKAIKAVTKAVGKVFGGGSSGGPGIAGTGRFKASKRTINKDAFKIKESEEAANRARQKEQESADRSKQAQQDRRGLIESLQAQASGTAPSLAEAQLKSASDRNLAQQLAASQSQRGGSASARQRQLLRGQAQAGRELAQDSATARIQERQSAQELLGQQISQEQQLSDQLTQNYLAQGFSIEQARQQALADLEGLETQQHLAAEGANLSGFQSAASQRSNLFGNVASGIGSALALSDENAKKKVKKAKKMDIGEALTKHKIETKSDSKTDATKYMKEPAPAPKPEKKESGLGDLAKIAGPAMAAMSDKKAKKNIKKDFLDKLTAYQYEYKNKYKKDGVGGEGVHTSVMAQDLEKAGPVGASMVQERPDGVKVVDYAKGYGAILAAQAHLNERLNELENKKSKKRK